MTASLANIIFGNETLYFLEKDKPETANIAKPIEVIASEPLVVETKEPISGTISPNKPENLEQKVVKTTDLVVIVRTLDNEIREFLSKILVSVGRNIDDIQIIDLETLSKTNIKAVIESTNAVFSFGVPFTSLGFKADLPAYILKMAREKHYLYADDLPTIQANANNEKRNLWNALKNILN